LFTLNSYTFSFESSTCNYLISHVPILHFNFARFVICTCNWQELNWPCPHKLCSSFSFCTLHGFTQNLVGLCLFCWVEKTLDFLFWSHMLHMLSCFTPISNSSPPRRTEGCLLSTYFLALSKNIVNFLLNLKLRSNYSNFATKQCRSM